MAMRSTLYLILLIILTTSSLHAQRRKPQGRGAKKPASHRLLWEISGNGLAKPSYLYGTMHVQDRRAFEFSDSVLLKFRGCTAFAAEMRLDSAIRQLFAQLLGDQEEEDDDDDEEEEETDGEVVELMAGKDTVLRYFDGDPEESYAPQSIDTARMEMAFASPEEYALDTAESLPSIEIPDAPSFIETESVPAEIDEDDEEVRTYTSFDTAISPRRRIDLSDNPLFSDFLTSRRTPRITDKPVFLDAYLTGLAHREGKELIGLETIDEQLEAAKSLRSIDNDMFDETSRKLSPAGLDPDDLIVYYRAGDLEKIALLLNNVLPPEAYSVMIVQRNFRMAERAERYIRQEPTFIAIGAGHLPGEKGVIQLLRDRGFTLRPVTARFTGLANSYALPPRDSSWSSITSETGAFSAEMPMDPIKLSLIDDDRASYQMSGSTYHWPDLLIGLSFTISYGDYMFGRDLDDTAELREVYDKRVAKVLRAYGQPVAIAVDGMPGLEFLTKETDGTFRRTRLILRRNRLYTVWVEGTRDLVHSADAEQFFTSFRLDPVKDAVWRTDTLTWGRCAVEAPGRLKRTERPHFSHADESSRYRYSNRMAEASYSVEVIRLSKYTQKDRDTLLGRQSSYMPWVTNRKMVTRNGIEGLEYDVLRDGYRWRTRTLLYGNRLYELEVMAPAEMLDSPMTDRFLDSFHPLGEPVALDILSDKSAMLLDDLRSADTAVAARARLAVDVYPFTAEHLPRIYDLLARPLVDDDSEDRTIKAALYSRLGDLRDPAAVPFIRSHYEEIERNVSVQYEALETLREIGTDEAMMTMAELMVRDTASEEGHSFSGIIYRLDVADGAKIFPTILPLLNNAKNRGALYNLAGNLLDSGMISRDLITPYTDMIVDDCARALRRYKRLRAEYGEDDEEYDEESAEDDGGRYEDGNDEEHASGHLEYGPRLLGYLPYSPGIDNVLRGMMRTESSYIALMGVEAYVRHKGTPSKSVLNRLAGDVRGRTELYRILDEAGRSMLFPEDHLSQRSFAESLLMRHLSNDEMFPDSLVFVAQRVVTSGERPGRVYLFKFQNNYDSKWMVGISGTQPLDEEKVSVSSDMVFTDYALLDDRTIDEHFEVLMKGDGK